MPLPPEEAIGTGHLRFLAIRDALKDGYDEKRLFLAKTDPGPNQQTLF